MSVGLRDQLLAVYTHSDAGANGWAQNAYTFAGEWWGGVRQLSARERFVGGQAAHEVDAIITLSDEAVVDTDAIIRRRDLYLGLDEFYRITGKTHRQLLREWELTAVRADDEVLDAVWQGDVAAVGITDVATVGLSDVASVVVTDVAELTPLTLT